MNRFAHLLDRLAFEPSRNAKLRLLTHYFSTTPDPDRGYALGAMAGALNFKHAKPALIRDMIAARVDPTLFAMSYDYVGDLSETIALLWPVSRSEPRQSEGPTLSFVVDTLAGTSRAAVPAQLAAFLDQLDETGRWALLKLITGGLRIGISQRLAKTAVAALGDVTPNDIEDVWHGLTMPYVDLFAWLEGRAEKPTSINPTPFRTPMLAHPLNADTITSLAAADFSAEWKWDGIRVQAVSGLGASGERVAKLWSRSGEDITAAFPDVADALLHPAFGTASLDGELLIMREGRVQPFSVLQQRLNRKTVSLKLCETYPAHIRAYDLLARNDADLRDLTFLERRKKLTVFMGELANQVGPLSRFDLSPLIEFATWDELAAARADPASAGADLDAEAVEGVMIKRWDSVYVAGRPTGPWWKWKREPFNVDAVLLYAQRGHGKRSSFYSDFTFGVWRAGESGDELVPVGKAYFGFTDAELTQLDKWVRNNTLNRFGPVREVSHGANQGLVLEIAFEGLNRSTRHKSGVAMRFPRIARIRWDKPAAQADRLETLEAMLKDIA